MDEMVLWVHCEAEGCSSLFAPSKGKRYCSGACRAQASLRARYILKPVHRKPEMTPERRALRMASEWLRGRIA